MGDSWRWGVEQGPLEGILPRPGLDPERLVGL